MYDDIKNANDTKTLNVTCKIKTIFIWEQLCKNKRGCTEKKKGKKLFFVKVILLATIIFLFIFCIF